jgi:hypothetical protein
MNRRLRPFEIDPSVRRVSHICALLLATLCSPTFADEVTLCSAHEEIYFSCRVGGKIASVCASGNISPNNGYVQYRFGRLNNIELEYPKLPYPPAKFFSISDINQGNAQSTHFKFRSGGYDYVIYSGFPSGLYVKNAGKIVSNMPCDPGGYESMSPRAFRGIPSKPPQSDIDD